MGTSTGFDGMGASGVPTGGESDTRFYVLGLAPNAARISVRFWLCATLAELAPRIVQHFDDLKIVRRFDGDPATPSGDAASSDSGEIPTVAPDGQNPDRRPSLTNQPTRSCCWYFEKSPDFGQQR